jgi:predicted deacylase
MANQDLELLPVDISAFRTGNTGINYVHTFDSGAGGPHVMVNALTHGNEVCGAHALTALLEADIRPLRGRLTVSFANIAAYDSFDPAQPGASRYIDEDFNRLWSDDILDSPRQSAELSRARELRPVVAEADYLLDIHSMQTDSPALMLSGLADKGRRLALDVGVPNFIVADAGHAAGPRMRDYRGFADPDSARTALLVECGQHWRLDSRTMAFDTLFRFLRTLGIIDADTAAPFVSADRTTPQRLIEVTEAVTIRHEDFAFAHSFAGLEVIAEKGSLLAIEGGKAILTPYDNCVLVMPTMRLKPGQTAVRLGRLLELPHDE